MSGGAALSRATVSATTIGAAFCIGLCRTAAGFLHQTVMRHKHVIGFLFHKDFALSLSQLTLVQHFVL